VSVSGRTGTGDRPYRRNRAKLLANTPDLCAICGHSGTMTADHIIPAKFWPRGPDGKHLPGLDDLENLQRAHGTMGAGRGRQNRCPVCRRLCNQSRGAGRRALRPSTRPWL
jgi:5-methylcytosine-specific restriction endonuclease McrA